MAKKLFEMERALREKREEYHAVAQTATAPELERMSDEIVAMTRAISDSIASGANACPQCGGPTMGMKRRPGVYEVGCLNCYDVRSIGESPDEAVEQWNAGIMAPPPAGRETVVDEEASKSKKKKDAGAE